MRVWVQRCLPGMREYEYRAVATREIALSFRGQQERLSGQFLSSAHDDRASECIACEGVLCLGRDQPIAAQELDGAVPETLPHDIIQTRFSNGEHRAHVNDLSKRLACGA